MEAYSMDLRSRVVNSYLAQEGSQADLAEQFKVSERWVQSLLRQVRESGSLEPLPHGGGRPRVISFDKEAVLLQVIAETPDASLDELRERCDIKGSRMCIARAFKRLNITRKKSRSSARNSKIPRCKSNARLGNGKSRTSTQGVSSSSTKPTPRPRLPVFLAERRVDSACVSMCPTDAGSR